jgi:drug/metabolite transporter (DMT)-like permease
MAQDGGETTARGLLAMGVAVFFFSISDAAAKWLGLRGIHAGEIVFFRYLFGLVPMGIAIWLTRGEGLATQRPLLHLVRALCMCGSLFLFFWGLAYVPLAEAIAIGFTAPIFITALSIPILGERVGPHRWAAVAVGFAGMLVIVQPGAEGFKPQALLIVAAAIVFSFAVLITRRMTASETNTAIFTYTTLVALCAMAPLAAMTWQSPQAIELGVLAMLGLVGGFAHFLVIVAYRHAAASVNASFEYTALVWGTIWGWVLWQETPGPATWIGAAIIVASGIYITVRETRRAVPVAPVPRRGAQ